MSLGRWPNWDDVKVSGVGRCDQNDAVVEDTVPRDPSIRYDEVINTEAKIKVSFYTTSLSMYLHPETCQLPADEPWGFQFHSSCWKILNLDFTLNLRLLFETCLSTPISEHSVSDWGHFYEGAAEFDTRWGRSCLMIASQFPGKCKPIP